jgi:hypothetical protein
LHLCARLNKQAYERARLINGYAARDAKYDMLPFHSVGL